MNEHTSIAAIAEMIENEIAPKPGDYNKIDIEDIVEKVRNSYSFVLWQMYMQNLNDSTRLLNTVLTNKKRFDVAKDTAVLSLEGLQIVDLPRDAGVYAVIASTGAGNGIQLIRSTPESVFRTPSRIPMKQRFYRVEKELFFPDGLPEKTIEVFVVFYGLADTNDEMNISRTVADIVYDKVKANYLPSVQIPADVSANKNPNPDGR